MRSYCYQFIHDENGVAVLETVCILACATILLIALSKLSGKLEKRTKRIKKDAIIKGSKKGYGSVTIK